METNLQPVTGTPFTAICATCHAFLENVPLNGLADLNAEPGTYHHRAHATRLDDGTWVLVGELTK